MADQARHPPSLDPFGPAAVLPPELQLYSFSYLNAITLVRASMVAKAWQTLCKSPCLWRRLCLQEHSPHARSRSSGSRNAQHISRPLKRDVVDWYNLYMRMDDNWRMGRSIPFQLPHPDYPFEGHNAAVYALQISGNYLVSGGSDRSIRIWDLRTRRLVGRPLLGHRGEVLCLQIDPRDGEDAIISGDKGGQLVGWRFSSAEMIQSIPHAHLDAVVSVKFNEKHVVTSSADQTIKIWDYQRICGRNDGPEGVSVRPLITLRGHEGVVTSIDFSGDSLVSVSSDNTVKLWSISQGTCLKTVGETRSIACVKFDDDTIVLGGREHSVALYNSRLESLGKRLYGHTDLVRSVQHRFGRGVTDIIVSGSHDGSVILWTKRGNRDWQSRPLEHSAAAASEQLEGCQEVASLPQPRSGSDMTHVPFVFGVDLNSRRVACCTERPTIHGWDFASGDPEITAVVAEG